MLKHDAEPTSSEDREILLVHRVDSSVAHSNRAGVGAIKAAEQMQEGRFSAAARPHDGAKARFVKVKINAPNRLYPAFTEDERLSEATDLDPVEFRCCFHRVGVGHNKSLRRTIELDAIPPTSRSIIAQ